MYVKIEKCSHGGWYKNHIGETWYVYEDCGNEYKCRSSDGYINFILKGDCSIVEELENVG